MKKVFTILTFLTLGVTITFAQIQEAQKGMSQGTSNSFSIELKTTVQKDIEKSWEKFAKNFKGKVKKDKKTGEIFADDCQLKSLSTNTVDVYATVSPSGPNTVLTVWYDLGGAYLNSTMHSEKIVLVENMLNDFALSVSINQVEEELKIQEKVLKDLDKDQKGLEKDKSKLEDDIKKYEQKIAEAKDQIKQNLEAQKAKQTEIEAQKKIVEGVQATLKKLK